MSNTLPQSFEVPAIPFPRRERHADTYRVLADFALSIGDVQARQEYLDMAEIFNQ